MVLSGSSIRTAVERGELGIEPFHEANLKGASYSFTLAPMVRVLDHVDELTVDGKQRFTEVVITDEGYLLLPNQFVLAYTRETLTLNGTFACMLSNRGSCAQVGLNVLLCSTFAEPDTKCPQTLEIVNVSGMPIRLMTGMKIVKGIFSKVSYQE